MNWNTELAYFVTPKSGPMRAMRTLRDVNNALLDDLPRTLRYQRHWFIVGRLVMAAAGGNTRLAVTLATDALLAALETEDWMTAQRRNAQLTVHDFRLPAKPDRVQMRVAA